ncbi:MAG: DUF1080 domain-containing protein [Pirellulaceae bacterium]|nr:DUF1080 domain-containing protein [Pirellulaceae bacterium]
MQSRDFSPGLAGLVGGLVLILAGCDSYLHDFGIKAQPTPTALPVATTVAAPAAAQAVAVAAVVADPPKPLTDEELAAGWIALFDGHSLFGWKAHSKADWQVKDGAIMVTSGEKGLLCTSVQFDNYVLKCDFRAAKDTNSGLFLRTAPVVGMDDVKTRCYELNIAPPENPFPTGSFVGRLKAKAVPERAGEWQSFEATIDGGKCIVKLNGEEVLAYTDPAPVGRGHIGLQLNSGQCEFKNIKLKPLGLESLFNGKDLTGWSNHPDSKSTFTVTDQGELHVTSTGRGALQSERQFGDFIGRFECISHAPSLNSGLFFRCIPGELTNGYECQVHNGFKNGDRTQPVDFGTGGIYRRIPARLVVPNDKEWFTTTLVADGPQIAVWVNGYQVTDWTDDRAPHDNPRNGLRTAPGTLQIQGHDPTTDLSFRNIAAKELEN